MTHAVTFNRRRSGNRLCLTVEQEATPRDRGAVKLPPRPWPAAVRIDAVASTNTATCEQCAELARLACGKPFCRRLPAGSGPSGLYHVILAGDECPLGKHTRRHPPCRSQKNN